MSQHYIFLVDYSYSMQSRISNVVYVLNVFFKKLRETGQKNVFITVAYFSCRFNEPIIYRQDVYSFDSITPDNFKNSGTTALYDAVCKTINGVGFKTSDTIFFNIITDGDDNNSSEYSREDADRLCKTAMELNWNIKHFDMMDENTLSVPKVKIDIDDIADLMTNLRM